MSLQKLQEKIEEIKEKLNDKDYVELCQLTKEVYALVPSENVLRRIRCGCDDEIRHDKFDLDSVIINLMLSHERAEQYARIIADIMGDERGIYACHRRYE